MNPKIPVALFLLLNVAAARPCRGAEREVVVQTNVQIRVMAANLNGNSQTIEPYAIRIFQGLKPDIVAIQEFRYLANNAADFRSFVNTAFGTNYYYYREPSTYALPNGVISRYPIRASGSWDDIELADRGFAWAQIDVPGETDLYVVSIHLKAGSGDAAVRAREAAVIKTLIQSNFSPGSWVVLAGDANLQSRTETALTTFKTFLSDDPIPADDLGNPNTNEPRSRPYDIVLTSPEFRTNFMPTSIGARLFTNGLVFDSRVFVELAAATPVQITDSGNGQHMAVVKDFRIPFLQTNRVSVTAPTLVLSTNSLHWAAVPGVNYALEATSDFVTWRTQVVGTATSAAFVVTNVITEATNEFFRVSY